MNTHLQENILNIITDWFVDEDDAKLLGKLRNLKGPVGVEQIAVELLHKQIATAEQINAARKHDPKSPIFWNLLSLGHVTEVCLMSFLRNFFGVPSICLTDMEKFDPEILQLVPKEVAKRHNLVPIAHERGVLLIAMIDPGNIDAMNDVRFLTGLPVGCVITTPSQMEKAQRSAYGS